MVKALLHIAQRSIMHLLEREDTDGVVHRPSRNGSGRTAYHHQCPLDVLDTIYADVRNSDDGTTLKGPPCCSGTPAASSLALLVPRTASTTAVVLRAPLQQASVRAGLLQTTRMMMHGCLRMMRMMLA